MLQNTINLQPENYLALDEEIIFYLGATVQNKNWSLIDKLKEQLLNAEVLTVCAHYKTDTYENFKLLLPDFLVNFQESLDKDNLQIVGIDTDRQLIKYKKYIYNHGVFTLIPNQGTAIIIDNVKQANSDYSDLDEWAMDGDYLRSVLRKITAYFDAEKEKEEENIVDRRMMRNVIEPIRNYTNYENLVELQAAMGNDYIFYEDYEVVSSKAGEQKFQFYSSSFDPENEKFGIDSFVDIETTEELNDEVKKRIKGIITDREISDRGVCFQISVRGQFDHSLIPRRDGRIFMQINDVQKRVRERVLNAIERGQVESQYMYRFFKNFSAGNYTPQEGWEEFKKKLEEGDRPPNPRQMEAIQRGIETDDIQLVLGPPGTGKTTVIVSWIDFFISQGKRILISSQNNSAVDNVLERAGKNERAHIVRIGNPEKVQENCQKYLPDRQVKDLAQIYENALQNGVSALVSDQRKLQKSLNEINQLFEPYQTAYAEAQKLFQMRSDMLKICKMMVERENTRKKELAEIERIMELRAQKRIFLYDTAHRNIFIRFLRRPYVAKVRKELKESEESLRAAVRAFDRTVEEYNAASESLQAKLADGPYRQEKRILEEAVKKCENAVLNPELTSVYKNQVRTYTVDRRDIEASVDSLNNAKKNYENYIRLLHKAEGAIGGFQKSLEQKRNDIVTNILLKSSNVVGATCIGINSKRDFAGIKFDVAIIDEAGQIQIHNAIVPMSRAKKTLMLGDHLQIPPLVNDDLARLCKMDGVSTELLEKSFFEYLFTKMENDDAKTPNLTRLDEQFRMPGNISDVISKWFYNGEYRARYDMTKWTPLIPGTHKPLVLVDTGKEEGRFEYSEDDAKQDMQRGKKVENCLTGPGYANVMEAQIAADIVTAVMNSGILKDRDDKGRPLEVQDHIGIISAYGKQVRTICNELRKRKLGLRDEQISAMCASLDSFQGQERPIIIYSSTRSTSYKNPDQARVGFMKELRRLNVAFTRCQVQLVIIGDIDYLTGCRYEMIDQETGEPVPNQSEKKYAEFMSTVVAQAKSENGEFLQRRELLARMGR